MCLEQVRVERPRGGEAALVRRVLHLVRAQLAGEGGGGDAKAEQGRGGGGGAAAIGGGVVRLDAAGGRGRRGHGCSRQGNGSH